MTQTFPQLKAAILKDIKSTVIEIYGRNGYDKELYDMMMHLFSKALDQVAQASIEAVRLKNLSKYDEIEYGFQSTMGYNQAVQTQRQKHANYLGQYYTRIVEVKL